MDKETREFFIEQMALQTKSLNEQMRHLAVTISASVDAKLESMERRFDAKLDAQLVDITNVVCEMGNMIDKRLEILEDDMNVNRKILLEREDKTKEKVDIQGDRIQEAFHHIERIEDHLQLDHSLVYDKSKKKYVSESEKE